MEFQTPESKEGAAPSIRTRQKIEQQIKEFARTPLPVLITGDSGVGKTYHAEEIHKNSPRAGKPFKAHNCARLKGEMVDAELFGIEDRTATGVDKSPGLFAMAHGGTIFLDEIGNLPEGTQGQILTVLSEGKFKRMGGAKDIDVDVRIITATNADIEDMVRRGSFRKDLYTRIVAHRLHLPPLRERPEDIKDLAEGFIRKCTEKHHEILPKKIETTIDPEVLAVLEQREWSPGNIRDLEYAIQKAVFSAAGDEEETNKIALKHLPPEDESGEGTLALIPDTLEAFGANVSTGKQERFVAVTEKMKKIEAEIATVAPYPNPVLITGELGVGKAHIAKAIHKQSTRGEKTFERINCAALTGENFKSELLGGQHSDLQHAMPGLLERAKAGTIFIEEIDKLQPDGQAALMHVLDTGVFRPHGYKNRVDLDVRVIAATTDDFYSENLTDRVRQGLFRSDLYCKLIEYRIEVPPLRKRHSEIKDLVISFIRIFNTEYRFKQKKQIDETLADDVLDHLKKNKWPGNIHQLRSATIRACINCTGTQLKQNDFPTETELSEIDATQATLPTPAEDEAFKDVFEALKRILEAEKTYRDYLKNYDIKYFTIYVIHTFKKRPDLALMKFKEMSVEKMCNSIEGLNKDTYYKKTPRTEDQEKLSEPLSLTLQNNADVLNNAISHKKTEDE